MTISRREAIQRTLLAGAACAVVRPSFTLAAEMPAADPFTLPALPYASDALEPSIDARTMEIHHGKHHAAYVSNLNKAVAGVPELAGKPLEEILRRLDAAPESVRTTVRNNGGGHYNHSLFWQSMKKGGAARRRERWPRRSTPGSAATTSSRRNWPGPPRPSLAAAGPG